MIIIPSNMKLTCTRFRLWKVNFVRVYWKSEKIYFFRSLVFFFGHLIFYLFGPSVFLFIRLFGFGLMSLSLYSPENKFMLNFKTTSKLKHKTCCLESFTNKIVVQSTTSKLHFIEVTSGKFALNCFSSKVKVSTKNLYVFLNWRII